MNPCGRVSVLLRVEFKGTKTQRRGAEGAEGALRNAYASASLCVLCASALNRPLLKAQPGCNRETKKGERFDSPFPAVSKFPKAVSRVRRGTRRAGAGGRCTSACRAKCSG